MIIGLGYVLMIAKNDLLIIIISSELRTIINTTVTQSSYCSGKLGDTRRRRRRRRRRRASPPPLELPSPAFAVDNSRELATRAQALFRYIYIYIYIYLAILSIFSKKKNSLTRLGIGRKMTKTVKNITFATKGWV